jgi:hypothetical protein
MHKGWKLIENKFFNSYVRKLSPSNAKTFAKIILYLLTNSSCQSSAQEKFQKRSNCLNFFKVKSHRHCDKWKEAQKNKISSRFKLN